MKTVTNRLLILSLEWCSRVQVFSKIKSRKTLKKSLIILNKFSLQIKLSDTYLGQTFYSDPTTSALATVKERQGKLKGATIEIRSIIEDYQMQAMGALTAAWELWERALIHSLISGAGTWLGDIEAAIKICNEIQNKVAQNCPFCVNQIGLILKGWFGNRSASFSHK